MIKIVLNYVNLESKNRAAGDVRAEESRSVCADLVNSGLSGITVYRPPPTFPLKMYKNVILGIVPFDVLNHSESIGMGQFWYNFWSKFFFVRFFGRNFFC